jgi:hypothetical protein
MALVGLKVIVAKGWEIVTSFTQQVIKVSLPYQSRDVMAYDVRTE